MLEVLRIALDDDLFREDVEMRVDDELFVSVGATYVKLKIYVRCSSR
jgi:hypothetical protein